MVRGAIATVNPFVDALVQVSTGSTQANDGSGKRTPTYATAQRASVQVQSLTADELHQLDGLNIQGVKRAIYMNGRVNGLVRAQNKGGDLITLLLPEREMWLVVLVIEYWPDWCKVAVVMQNGS